jgi:hypothetical protein
MHADAVMEPAVAGAQVAAAAGTVAPREPGATVARRPGAARVCWVRRCRHALRHQLVPDQAQGSEVTTSVCARLWLPCVCVGMF